MKIPYHPGFSLRKTKEQKYSAGKSMNEFSQVIEKNFGFLYKMFFLSIEVGLKASGLASHY